MRVSRSLARLAGALMGLCAGLPVVYACACCTNTGQRYDAVETSDRLDEIGRLRFGPTARLFTGEAEPADIQGIREPSSRYDLSVVREAARWVFTFATGTGSRERLRSLCPSRISVLEVDPRRGERPGGIGPTLYKEWKLTVRAAGTGIFAPGMGGEARMTLVLQGHGNSCASAADFTHWMLIVSGRVTRYHLFGNLAPP